MNIRIGAFTVAALLALSSVSSQSHAEEPAPSPQSPKLQQLHEKGAGASALKTLDADNAKLEKAFSELLVNQGYISAGGNCRTVCTVSCTWVNGQCQPTTSCSVQCDW